MAFWQPATIVAATQCCGLDVNRWWINPLLCIDLVAELFSPLGKLCTVIYRCRSWRKFHL